MCLEKIKKICFESDFTRSQYAYKIISSGILDKQIKNIKYEKVKTSMYNTFENGLTDTYNLFVLNIDKFLMFLEFNFLLSNNERFVILTNIFESKYTSLFISKKDINSKRTWYINQYKKLIIDKFFKNLKKIYKQNIKEINDIIDSRIKIDKISFSKEEDVDAVFHFLKDLINCTRDDTRFLFYDANTTLYNSLYFNILYGIFNNYKKRHQYLILLGL